MSTELLTLDQVAKRLQISEIAVRRLIQREGLVAVRLNRHTQRVSESDLAAFIASKRAQTAARKPA
jgi:excisionase family DNA binding protein